jgi:hypothetical protein
MDSLALTNVLLIFFMFGLFLELRYLIKKIEGINIGIHAIKGMLIMKFDRDLSNERHAQERMANESGTNIEF